MRGFRIKTNEGLLSNKQDYLSPRATTTISTTRSNRYNSEKEEKTFEVTPEELKIEDFNRKQLYIMDLKIINISCKP